ncbi:hypothetical protein EZI54_20810 [Marinobacter halodurans]|uniref:TRAP transporter small permease n=1 Tax=Marinobacter halodurans TaxID=2528979 RepID=A0ABY1ZF71_9GAMM|nr:hypothetical protein [Marinobacter halodurans]TBW48734.1 hypothetical protein EZI54_20810 [Marinobacter halodurans]
MEHVEAVDVEEHRLTSPTRHIDPDGLAVIVGIATACLSIAALFMVNLQYIWPNLAQQVGQPLPYEHKLWLLPTSIMLLFASLVWIMGHLRTSRREVH